MWYREGDVVISLSGHDRGRLYIVCESGEKRILVADGKRRGMANPKSKNPKHLKKYGEGIFDIKSDKDLRQQLNRRKLNREQEVC